MKSLYGAFPRSRASLKASRFETKALVMVAFSAWLMGLPAVSADNDTFEKGTPTFKAAAIAIEAHAARSLSDPIQFSAPQQWHRIHIVSEPVGDVVFAYSDTTAASGGYKLFGCVNKRMPDRKFRQKGGDIVVFAKTGCDWNTPSLPIRGAQNGNGWDFEVDAANNGTYSMKVRFDF